MFLGTLIVIFPLEILANASGDSAVKFLIENYLSFIGIWIVLLIFMNSWEKPLLKNFGTAFKGNTLKNFAIGLLMGFGMNLICALVAMLNKDIILSFDGIDIVYLLLAFAVVLIQSGAEEALCRGYVFQALRERYGYLFAAIVNSAIFAAMHLGNPGITWISVAEIFVIGYLFSMMMEHVQSLWMPIAVHTAWNYTQNIILGLPNSGLVSEKAIFRLEGAKESILYSFKFGIEGGIPSVIICVLACVAIYFIYKKKK